MTPERVQIAMGVGLGFVLTLIAAALLEWLK